MSQAFLRRWWFMVVLGGMLGLATLQPPPVYACSCVMDPHQEAPAAALQRAGAVFAGKVTHINDLFRGWTGLPVSVTFDVSQVWKGPVQQRIAIKTGSGGGDCGIDFLPGEEYIVYAYNAQDHPRTGSGLAANICSRTNLLVDAQADLAGLGAGMVPPPDTTAPDSATILCLVSLLVGALLLATGFLVRARRRRATF